MKPDSDFINDNYNLFQENISKRDLQIMIKDLIKNIFEDVFFCQKNQATYVSKH